MGVWTHRHLTFKEDHQQCMQKASTGEARPRPLTDVHWVVPAWLGAVLVVCVEAIALYGCELWWNPKEGSRRDILQLLLNPQAMSTVGARTTTMRGTPIRVSRLTLAAVALDFRPQRCVSRLASGCETSGRKSSRITLHLVQRLAQWPQLSTLPAGEQRRCAGQTQG